MALSSKSVHGYLANERKLPEETTAITLREQDLIWKRDGRSPDILVALGARSPPYNQPRTSESLPTWMADFRLKNDAELLSRSTNALLASLFYLELVGVPQLDELGHMFCRLQVRCRIAPTSRAYRILIAKLREHRSRFYFDYQSVPCVSQQLHDEAGRGIAFSRCIEMSVPTLAHSLDVKIDGITSTSQRISNCPYRLQHLIEDEGLNCVFGNKDHKLRYFGPMNSSARFI
ncbi:MAG: hypothetical protein CL912_21150 [Deltaproteobacteria bacterium]|nr:hypothetical protein [Deltaproteobacteria bacterium]